MKVVLAVFLNSLMLLSTPSYAWVFPIPDVTREAFLRASSIATISAAIASAPLNANAAVDFAGSYADPFHTNCQRVIVVPSPGQAIIKGTDGNPGCPADGSGKSWELTGRIEGSSILVDFSPKGGPKDLKGVFDAASPSGIKWPDGNKWALIKSASS